MLSIDWDPEVLIELCDKNIFSPNIQSHYPININGKLKVSFLAAKIKIKLDILT